MNPPISMPIGTVIKSRVCPVTYRVTGEPSPDPKQEWVWPCVFHPDGVTEYQIGLAEMQERFEVVR